MQDKFVLAIDQGTTNTKVLLLDRCGRLTARASSPLAIRYPQPAWVEQDAEALWSSVTEAIDDCLAQVDHPALAAIGISNQRESVVIWDRDSGRAAGPCVVWQCRRSADFCEQLRHRGLEALLRERTGLAVDPLFSAGKIRWLLDNIPDGRLKAEAGQLCAGTVDSWLLWNLTGGAVHACDATNASRTQLLDLRRLAWDEELLEIFGVPSQVLPKVSRSSGILGESTALGRLPAGVPIASLIGDSHAALFGHAAFRPGAVKATYGTGSSLMTAFGAIMLMAQIGVGDPRQGASYTLSSITAVVLGGTSLRGGRGTFVGTVLGALLLTEVLNAVSFLNLSETYQYVFQGALILVAALIYSTVRRRAAA